VRVQTRTDLDVLGPKRDVSKESRRGYSYLRPTMDVISKREGPGLRLAGKSTG
jgi:hypothetical protein